MVASVARERARCGLWGKERVRARARRREAAGRSRSRWRVAAAGAHRVGAQRGHAHQAQRAGDGALGGALHAAADACAAGGLLAARGAALQRPEAPCLRTRASAAARRRSRRTQAPLPGRRRWLRRAAQRVSVARRGVSRAETRTNVVRVDRRLRLMHQLDQRLRHRRCRSIAAAARRHGCRQVRKEGVPGPAGGRACRRSALWAAKRLRSSDCARERPAQSRRRPGDACGSATRMQLVPMHRACAVGGVWRRTRSISWATTQGRQPLPKQARKKPVHRFGGRCVIDAHLLARSSAVATAALPPVLSARCGGELARALHVRCAAYLSCSVIACSRAHDAGAPAGGARRRPRGRARRAGRRR